MLRLPGYRSPSRPIPTEVILDTVVLMDSVQMHHGESTSNHLGNSLVENDRESVLLYNDKSITDSCKKDAWWLEAIRFADTVESVRHMRDLTDTVRLFALIHLHIVVLVPPNSFTTAVF